MAESTVRELLSPAITLDFAATVAEALRQLEQAGVSFGLVQDEQGQLLGVVSAETLGKAAPEERLHGAFCRAGNWCSGPPAWSPVTPPTGWRARRWICSTLSAP